MLTFNITIIIISICLISVLKETNAGNINLFQRSFFFNFDNIS